MTVQDTIRKKLEKEFDPVELVIEDQSHMHKGHAGHRPGGETHFHVRIVSPIFKGMGRLERQRRVTGVLSELMNNPIHALSMKTMSPDEAGQEIKR